MHTSRTQPSEKAFTLRNRSLITGALALFALLAALVMPAASAQGQPQGQVEGHDQVTAQEAVRVMPLGDSITDGFNVPGGYRIDLWNNFQADGYNVDFVGSMRNGPFNLGDQDHEGHSGWTIQQIDQNIANWISAYNPQTILLHIGTNDMYGSDPNGAPGRMRTLVNNITSLAPDAQLFVATIVPLGFGNETVQQFNSQIPGIVQEQVDAGKNVHLVDMYNALTTADLADGVHPNGTGYSKMAATWYEALLSVPGSIGNDVVDPEGAQPAGHAAAR